MRKSKITAIIMAFLLSFVGIAYAATVSKSGTGPTMTQRGQMYTQNLTFPTTGQAIRTINGVSWSWRFNTGNQFCFGGIGGSTTCVPNPQPSNMTVWLCLAGENACADITGQQTGTTNIWNGHTFYGAPGYATLVFLPNGSGALSPVAYGATNSVTVGYY